MSQDTEHTPTPWKSYKDAIHPILEFNSSTANDFYAICGEFYGPDAELNRAFIVRAVNAHDALVAALEEAEKSLGDAECSLIEYEAPGSTIEYIQEARKQARDALLTAKGDV